MPASLARVTLAMASLGCHSVVSCEGQTHRAAGATLECSVHRACVAHKIRSCPRISFEEIERKHTALETITRTTGRHKISGIVRSATSQREDMIEGGTAMVETLGTVHAALTAVTQGHAAHGLFRRHVGGNLWPK